MAVVRPSDSRLDTLNSLVWIWISIEDNGVEVWYQPCGPVCKGRRCSRSLTIVNPQISKGDITSDILMAIGYTVLSGS